MTIGLILEILMLSVGFITVAALILNYDKKRTEKKLQVELAQYKQQFKTQYSNVKG